MALIAISGRFFVQGYSPDGDSIRFQANQADSWDRLPGETLKRNQHHHVQIRFQAIDTLETHYKGYHQPPQYAQQATDLCLAQLGIEQVTWNKAGTHVDTAVDGTQGWILTESKDVHGRPLAFVFGQTTSTSPTHHWQDGQTVFLDSLLLRQSLNYQLLAQGLAFPMFYQGLFPDLRQVMAQATITARQQGKGFWPLDRTNHGIDINSMGSLTMDEVIMPKLFRRVVFHLRTGASMETFLPELAIDPESVLVFPPAYPTQFDQLIEVDGNHLRLREQPENLVFLD
jgi:endonuclease YncB( thermonuclease family)